MIFVWFSVFGGDFAVSIYWYPGQAQFQPEVQPASSELDSPPGVALPTAAPKISGFEFFSPVPENARQSSG